MNTIVFELGPFAVEIPLQLTGQITLVFLSVLLFVAFALLMALTAARGQYSRIDWTAWRTEPLVATSFAVLLSLLLLLVSVYGWLVAWVLCGLEAVCLWAVLGACWHELLRIHEQCVSVENRLVQLGGQAQARSQPVAAAASAAGRVVAEAHAAAERSVVAAAAATVATATAQLEAAVAATRARRVPAPTAQVAAAVTDITNARPAPAPRRRRAAAVAGVEIVTKPRRILDLITPPPAPPPPEPKKSKRRKR